MVRIVFLIMILIIQLYGLFCCLKNFVKPSSAVESLKKLNAKDAQAAGAFMTIVMAILYSVTFALIARVIANKELAITFLFLAAFELVLIFPRLAHLGKIYSGTVQEQINKWLVYEKSYKRVLGFIGNLLETVIIVIALYYLFKEGTF